jgi:hypothetical protein
MLQSQQYTNCFRQEQGKIPLRLFEKNEPITNLKEMAFSNVERYTDAAVFEQVFISTTISYLNFLPNF